MGGKNDAALQGIVDDDVVGDEIAAAFGGVVADENAICIARDEVVGHDCVHRSEQVNRAAAVATLIGFIGGLAVAGGAGTEDGPLLVVGEDAIVADGGGGGVENQNSFVQGVLHRESGDRHIAE